MSEQISGETGTQGGIRRLRRDSRSDENVQLIGYETEEGKVLASTGDREAMYVKVLGTVAVSSIAGDVNVQGVYAHDEAIPATHYPVLTGGYGYDEAPAAVSANADMVHFWSDLIGRLHTYHDLSFAGENLVQDWMRTMPAVAAVEQESVLWQTEIGSLGAGNASIIAKASAGRVFGVYALNRTGAAAYLQIVNGVGTGVPTFAPLAIPDGASGSIIFDAPRGLYHDTGIVAQLSSTDVTFTAVAANSWALSVCYF